jgi:Uma2 family endonuclease
MSSALTPTTRPRLTPPLGPTLEEWARMSPSQQAALEENLYEAAREYERALRATLSPAEQEAMAESDSHQDSSHDSKMSLRTYFRRAGGALYIASNLAVYYPGQEHFDPDLLAVRDVPLRKRSSYIVAQEGKGLDLVVEILYRGSRRKDLTDNLARFARLGIPEYFVADIARRRIHGYHLTTPESRRYTPLLGDAGRYRSTVLGLDLAIEEEQLRFYSGTARIPLLSEEVDRLTEQVEKERELAAAAEEEARAAEEKATAAEEEARALRQQLGEAILSILRLRGLSPSEEQAARIRCCADAGLLRRWLGRAVSVSLEELFLDS